MLSKLLTSLVDYCKIMDHFQILVHPAVYIHSHVHKSFVEYFLKAFVVFVNFGTGSPMNLDFVPQDS